MNIKQALAVTFALACALASFASEAATITTYNNRAAFESALAGETVDLLDGLARGWYAGVTVRPGYSFVSSDQYGCHLTIDCGDNSSEGVAFTDGTPYLWSYGGADVFTFASAVNGFGFDFADPACCKTGSFAIIDGLASSAGKGFFGLISSDAKTQFSVDQTGPYMVMDKLTFGLLAAAPGAVPEPSAPALVGLCLLGVAWSRRRDSR